MKGIKKLLCKIFGHKYIPIWSDKTVKYTDTVDITNFKFKCKRCGIIKT